MDDFLKYFKENMDGLGLPAADSLFGNSQAILAASAVLQTEIERFGPRVTIKELARAGSVLERVRFLGAVSAAYYLSAVVGCVAVATGRSLAGGTSLGDVIFEARRMNVDSPWLRKTLSRWPGIYVRESTHFPKSGAR